MNPLKKIVSILIIALLFTLNLKSQTVDSIKVEQAGDFIKIRYKILNSTPEQIYRVKVLCSIGGGMNNEIRSISGDVGDQVIGGKPEYWVVWDVLKDLDEIKSVEFIVRAELLNDARLKSTNKPYVDWENKTIYIMPSFGEGWDKGVRTYGIRLAIMGSWGLSGKFLLGNDVDDSENIRVFHSSADLAKRIINKDGFQMYIMAGLAFGKLQVKHPGTMGGSGTYFIVNPTFELGGIVAIRRFVISCGLTPFDAFKGNITDGDELVEGTYINWGFGMRF